MDGDMEMKGLGVCMREREREIRLGEGVLIDVLQ